MTVNGRRVFIYTGMVTENRYCTLADYGLYGVMSEQMGHVLAIRSENESLFSQGLLSNKPLLGAFFITFMLQMATIYVPFLNPIFKPQPLSLNELLIIFGLSSIVFFAVEAEKWSKRRQIKI